MKFGNRPSGAGPAHDPDFALIEKLRERGVSVDLPDANTIHMRNVPANGMYFNKSTTNVLIKKLPFVLCVDDDLEYCGDDPELVRAFTASGSHNGWRILFLGYRDQDDSSRTIRSALAVLGSGGNAPTLTPAQCTPGQAGPATLLASFGCNLSREARAGPAAPCIGRAELLEPVLSCLVQRQRNLVLIVGESGVGKTNLLHAIAQKVVVLKLPFELHRVDMGALMSGTLFDGERERLLASLLDEVSATRRVVLCMEHAEQAVSGVPRGTLLLAQALERGARLVGTTTAESVGRFHRAPLVRRLRLVELSEMSQKETVEILSALRAEFEDCHHVKIDGSLLTVVVQRSSSLAGTLPSKAVALLDAASARAHLAGVPEMRLEDVYLAAANFREERGQ